MLTEQASQGIAVPATMVPPQSSSSTLTTGAVDMQKFRRAMFIAMVGAFGSSATVDFKVQQSVDGSTGWTDLAGAAITQLLAAGGNNRLAIVEAAGAMLTAGYRYVRGSITVGTAASLVSVIPLGLDAEQKPASQFNDASVAQRVVV